MKIKQVVLDNFASYGRLHFEFQEEGLVLIHGPTGAGKSTLMDAVPWVLFGRTAKGGAVDEVRSWDTTETTIGCVFIQVDGKDIHVERRRGVKAKDNDMRFTVLCPENGHRDVRGKDIADTQRLLNALLGISAELYLSGAYFHEFSQTAQFFSAPAKLRRTICEQIVDLSLPKRLSVALADRRKELAAQKNELDVQIKANKTQIGFIERRMKTTMQWAEDFDTERALKIRNLYELADTFDRVKAERIARLQELSQNFEIKRKEDLLDAIADTNAAETAMTPDFDIVGAEQSLANRRQALSKAKCSHCGNSTAARELATIAAEASELAMTTSLIRLAQGHYRRGISRQGEIEHLQNPYIGQIEDQKSATNTHLAAIDDLEKFGNPHLSAVAEDNRSLEYATESNEEDLAMLAVVAEMIEDVEMLIDTNAALRSVLVKNTITGLESQTNAFLSEHFDAEMRIELIIEDDDKLDVTIFKDGNQCVYTQLSKGQRQLLKLCFGVSVMKAVSNHHATDFNTVFFDEALDGLDETFKAMAFDLLQSLALDYDNVLVVEHSSELKALFDTSYHVEIKDGRSRIEKAG